MSMPRAGYVSAQLLHIVATGSATAKTAADVDYVTIGRSIRFLRSASPSSHHHCRLSLLGPVNPLLELVHTCHSRQTSLAPYIFISLYRPTQCALLANHPDLVSTPTRSSSPCFTPHFDALRLLEPSLARKHIKYLPRNGDISRLPAILSLLAETTPQGLGSAMRTLLLCSSLFLSSRICLRPDNMGGLR